MGAWRIGGREEEKHSEGVQCELPRAAPYYFAYHIESTYIYGMLWKNRNLLTVKVVLHPQNIE
jgi:hypothetical protein